MTEKIYKTPYGDIHYWTNDVRKVRKTLVFLPGLTSDHRLFDKQTEAFRDICNVLVWDAPGHAASYPFEFTFDLTDKARWLDGILRVEGIDAPILVGQSIGGYLAQVYMELFPTKARGFVAIDSASLQRKKYLHDIELRMLRRMEGVYRHFPWKILMKAAVGGVAVTEYGKNQMRDMVSVYVRDPKWYTTLSGHGLTMLAKALEADLPYEIPCPVLLICGEKDRAGAQIRYNRAWHKFAGYRLEWIPDAGHNSNADQPELVNALLGEFVRSLP